jgi:chorismate mutase / prephenate dehydratase
MDNLRARIDDLDEQILALLSERGKLAQAIAKVKQDSNASLFVPSRERQILEHLVETNIGPLSSESIRVIYEQIIAACRMLESPISVAYLGPPATFSHMAASRKFGPQATLVPCATIDDAFLAVEKKIADFGVVPVENSIGGVERTTLDRFVSSPLRICAEYFLDIRLNLLSKSALKEIKRVYSHPQPLAQSQHWLRTNLSEAETVEVSSTTRAAQLASSEPEAAAVGTEAAAELYGLPIIATGIQDHPDNRTRFLIIGREEAQPSGKDKTTLMFSAPHRAGSLWEILGVFHRHNINLTMIESRPTKQTPWEYVFFTDLLGHCTQEPLHTALEEISANTPFVKVLGSYPEAE